MQVAKVPLGRLVLKKLSYLANRGKITSIRRKYEMVVIPKKDVCARWWYSRWLCGLLGEFFEFYCNRTLQFDICMSRYFVSKLHYIFLTDAACCHTWIYRGNYNGLVFLRTRVGVSFCGNLEVQRYEAM